MKGETNVSEKHTISIFRAVGGKAERRENAGGNHEKLNT
jgi:hypothetical protein